MKTFEKSSAYPFTVQKKGDFWFGFNCETGEYFGIPQTDAGQAEFFLEDYARSFEVVKAINFDDLFDSVLCTGGATVRCDGTIPSFGFVSAISKSYEKVYEKDFFLSDFKNLIENFIYSNCLTVKNYGIGIWEDAGLIYVDLVSIFTYADDAIRYGKEQGQKAIFNLSNKETIFLWGESWINWIE